MLGYSFNDSVSNYGGQSYIIPTSVANTAISHSMYSVSRNALASRKLENTSRSFLQVSASSGVTFVVSRTTLTCSLDGILTIQKPTIASVSLPSGFPTVAQFCSLNQPRVTNSLGLDSVIHIGSKTYCIISQLSSGQSFLFEFTFNESAGTAVLQNTGIVVAGTSQIEFVHFDPSAGQLYVIWQEPFGSGLESGTILKMTRLELTSTGSFTVSPMSGLGILSISQPEGSPSKRWGIAVGVNANGETLLSFVRTLRILSTPTNSYTYRRQAMTVTCIPGAASTVTEIQASNSVLVGQASTYVWEYGNIVFLNSLGNVLISGNGNVVAYNMDTAQVGTTSLGTLVIRDIAPEVNAPDYDIFRLIP